MVRDPGLVTAGWKLSASKWQALFYLLLPKGASKLMDLLKITQLVTAEPRLCIGLSFHSTTKIFSQISLRVRIT